MRGNEEGTGGGKVTRERVVMRGEGCEKRRKGGGADGPRNHSAVYCVLYHRLAQPTHGAPPYTWPNPRGTQTYGVLIGR